MNKSFFLFFFLLLSANVFSQEGAAIEIKNLDPRAEKIDKYELRADRLIGKKLFSGNFLIYNCTDKFYACVNDISNDDCTQKRKVAISEGKKVYPCAPIKKFNSYLECSEYNLKIINDVIPTRFCFPK